MSYVLERGGVREDMRFLEGNEEGRGREGRKDTREGNVNV